VHHHGAHRRSGVRPSGGRRRRGSRGGRPIRHDRTAYRRRNVVERAFTQLKSWRGIATRYDEHATVFHGALVLASILI
jgi:transposase